MSKAARSNRFGPGSGEKHKQPEALSCAMRRSS